MANNSHGVYIVCVKAEIAGKYGKNSVNLVPASRALARKIDVFHYELLGTDSSRSTQIVDSRSGTFVVSGYTSWEAVEHRRPPAMRLFYTDAWERERIEFENGYRLDMPARFCSAEGEHCVYFGDIVPEGHFTHICYAGEEHNMRYWLEYRLGEDCIVEEKQIFLPRNGKNPFWGNLTLFRSRRNPAVEGNEDRFLASLLEQSLPGNEMPGHSPAMTKEDRENQNSGNRKTFSALKPGELENQLDELQSRVRAELKTHVKIVREKTRKKPLLRTLFFECADLSGVDIQSIRDAVESFSTAYAKVYLLPQTRSYWDATLGPNPFPNRISIVLRIDYEVYKQLFPADTKSNP